MKWMETTHSRVRGSKFLNLAESVSEQKNIASKPAETSEEEGAGNLTPSAAGAPLRGPEAPTKMPDEVLSRPPEREKKSHAFQSQLGKLKEIDGFSGVGIFSPSGEMVESFEAVNLNLVELGAIANEILLKSQKASESMGLGKSDFVHIQTAKAHVLMRCIEETGEPRPSAGGAHLHLVLVIQPSGNLALAKIKLNSLVQEIVSFFR